MELHGQAISEDIVEKHFKTHQMPNKPSRQNRTNKAIDFSRIDFYNQKFIELNTTQLNTATKTSLPLIISGAAGSGKSCIALLILAQYIESNYLNEFPILYVTESDNLANSMQRVWSSLPIAQNLDANAVQFKSYQQLIIEQADDENLIFVGKEHCLNWLVDHYIKQYKKISSIVKNKSISDSLFDDIDAIYQEFRIISGCTDYKSYNLLGSKQSIFDTEADQQWLFNAFTAYQAHLKNQKSVHAPFYPLAARDKFKRIVVDEAQDFSHRQLEILANLAKDKQICFCEDNRQSLQDNKSKITFLKNLIHSWDMDANIVPLNASYRCPENIIKITNALSGLKAVATGHGQEDITCPENQANKGHVSWFAELSDKEIAKLQHEASSPDFAIITLKEHKEGAKKLFKTDLVFTVDEIKGLEYKKVMTWRLFDDPLFKEADAYIGQQSVDIIKKSGNRAKKDQGNEQFGPLFSSVYTAFTRAIDTLYIYQPKSHKLENITTKLIDAIDKEQAPILAETLVSSEENTNAWFTQVKLQLTIGNEDIAKGIYVNTLHKSAEEFEIFKASFLKPEDHTVYIKKNKKQPTTLTNNNAVIVKSTSKTAITKAPQIQNKPKTTPAIPDEIKRLISNLNDNTLSAFLNRKNGMNLLFHTPISPYSCLFQFMCSFPHSKKVLFAVINSHKKIRTSIVKNITKDALCHPDYLQCTTLYWLAFDGMDVFQSLISINPGILDLITTEALCLPVRLQNIVSSPLYWFTSTGKGIKALTTLITHNPKLVSLYALCLPMTLEQGIHSSAFFSLAYMEKGQELLELLLANIEIDPEMLGNVLCCKRIDNMFPLYVLCSNPVGQKMLINLLNRAPRLAEYIPAEKLCGNFFTKNGDEVNIPVVHSLSRSDLGQQVIYKLITGNSKLAEAISPLVLPADDYFLNKPAILYWNLIITTLGKEILDIVNFNRPRQPEILNESNQKSTSPVELGFFSQTGVQGEANQAEADILDAMVNIPK